jgi:hypothetical protein
LTDDGLKLRSAMHLDADLEHCGEIAALDQECVGAMMWDGGPQRGRT